MIYHFKNRFPELSAYWDKYLPFQKRMEVPAKAILLKEGAQARNYIFIEKGCIRLSVTSQGRDRTVQFFFEGQGLTSFESFIKNTPSPFNLITVEPCVLHLLPKTYVKQLLDELTKEPAFNFILLDLMADRQIHYMNEFVSLLRDTPEERYLQLISDRPHIIQRVPQQYIAAYLGISRVHLSRIKQSLSRKK